MWLFDFRQCLTLVTAFRTHRESKYALFARTGIGLDDVYILVSSWRFTSVTMSTEGRVEQMLKDSAVSITITSVTDVLAFGIGLLSV